MLPPN